MCFYKDSYYKHRNIKTAGKNIPCFKVLVYCSNFDNFKYVSPYMCTDYFKIINGNIDSDFVTKASKFSPDHETSSEIHEGLHTYSTVNASKNLTRKFYYSDIFKAYIPKGTRYYYNSKDHEYVSEKLVVTSNKKYNYVLL